jgi:chemotaxis protein MotB
MGPGGASTSAHQPRRRHGCAKPRAEKGNGPSAGTLQKPADIDEAKRLAAEAERKQLLSLLQDLRAAIDKSHTLRPFKDQLLLDITPEGLRIQIVDAQNRPMFDLGSAKLKDYTASILHELTSYLNSVPNHISLSGHTDTTPYSRSRLHQLGSVRRPRQCGAARARSRWTERRQDRARRRLSSVVLFDKEEAAQPDQPAHQHHRDDKAGRGSSRTRRCSNRPNRSTSRSRRPCPDCAPRRRLIMASI